MSYTLGQRSLDSLRGVHPKLVAIVERAIQLTTQDFTVIEGLRTIERQRQLVAQGASKTMNSFHITGHAVDIIPYPIPSNWNQYTSTQWQAISIAMKQAARELKVPLTWGGDWKSFVDKPHYQIPRTL